MSSDASSFTEREAACSCQRLRLTVWGAPSAVFACNCYECQRRTGSVFSVQALFPIHLVRIEGDSREFHRISDGGEMRNFHFCTNCGSTVYCTFPARPDSILVTVGAFADRDFPPPRVWVWENHRHPWVTFPPGIEYREVDRPQ